MIGAFFASFLGQGATIHLPKPSWGMFFIHQPPEDLANEQPSQPKHTHFKNAHREAPPAPPERFLISGPHLAHFLQAITRRYSRLPDWK